MSIWDFASRLRTRCPSVRLVCLDRSKSTKDILNAYLVRWDVGVSIHQSKEKLAFGQCRLCSSQGIRRYWLDVPDPFPMLREDW